MNKTLKDMYHQWLADADDLPPLNDEDDFFYVDKTAEQQRAYNYESHKIALGLFYKEVDLFTVLIEEILTLKREIEKLKKRR